jgi:hypothetical protein
MYKGASSAIGSHNPKRSSVTFKLPGIKKGEIKRH